MKTYREFMYQSIPKPPIPSPQGKLPGHLTVLNLVKFLAMLAV